MVQVPGHGENKHVTLTEPLASPSMAYICPRRVGATSNIQEGAMVSEC